MSPDPAVAPRAVVLSSLGADAFAVILAGSIGFVIVLPAPVAGAITASVAMLAALMIWRGTLGGSVGHTILRLRTVDELSGLPSFRFHSPRHVVRRHGEDDPFALRARPFAASAAAPPTPGAERHRSHLRLIVDDGTTHTVQRSALIGRDPTVPLDPRHALVAIPDLTRTISKVHLLVEIIAEGLSVTDLGSSNGTYIEGADAPLAPHHASLVSWGSTLLLGDRRVILEQRRRSTEVS